MPATPPAGVHTQAEVILSKGTTTPRSLGIFGRLFIAFVAAALLPLGLTWYLARDRAIDDASAYADLHLESQAAAIAARVDGWLRLNRQSMIEHARTPAMMSMRPELQRPVLVTMQQAQPWSYLMFTAGADGMSLARSDELPQTAYGDRGYFRTVMRDGAAFGQEVLIGRSSGRPAWILAEPIREPGGRVVGVLARASHLSEITSTLVERRIGETGRAMLLSASGQLIAKTGAAVEGQLQDMSAHPAFQAARAGASELRFVADDGEAMIGRVKTNEFGWSVAVFMAEAEVLAGVRQTNLFMAALLLGALLVATAFAWFVAPTLARPIERLTAITEEISRGKFDHAIAETGRGDEIGALARSIERMTRSLRIAMSRLAAKAPA